MNIKQTQERAFGNIINALGASKQELALVSPSPSVQNMAIRQAVFESSRVSSRKTVTLMPVSDILSLYPADYAGQSRTDASLPVLKLRQENDDEGILNVTGAVGLDAIRAHAGSDALIPVELEFPDSPGRKDDGLWNLMTTPPHSLVGFSYDGPASVVSLPAPATSARLNGVDEDVAQSIGAASDALYAVMSFVPRCPRTAGNPAGDAAEEWASKRSSVRLMETGPERLMKKAVDIAMADKLGDKLINRGVLAMAR